MLMDLNKDYLKDLEINLLGDIILVLKYAKKVDKFYTVLIFCMNDNDNSTKG